MYRGFEGSDKNNDLYRTSSLLTPIAFCPTLLLRFLVAREVWDLGPIMVQTLLIPKR